MVDPDPVKHEVDIDGLPDAQAVQDDAGCYPPALSGCGQELEDLGDFGLLGFGVAGKETLGFFRLGVLVDLGGFLLGGRGAWYGRRLPQGWLGIGV